VRINTIKNSECTFYLYYYSFLL